MSSETAVATEFHYAVGEDGVAVITWDVGPKRSMNVLSVAGVRQLDAHLDAAIADAAVKGVVLTSAKADLAGGMDLNVIGSLTAEAQAAGREPAAAVFEMVMGLHTVLRKIERMGADPKTGRGGKPFVVATPGTALGIGYEIMLAAHHRIAAENASAKIGLPEVKVGIFPGAGGTTRLIRMMGVMGAAPYLLEGKLLEPSKAKSAGLVDAVVPPEELVSAARAWVLAAEPAAIIKPWDQKGYKMPGGAPYHPAGFMTFLGGVAMTHGKTQGVYPAIDAMLSAIYEGALVDFDTALRVEARWFTQVLMNPSSAAMIRTLFVDKTAIEKGARRPELPDMAVRKLGVVGAGMMGAGIAHAGLGAGVEVVLIDRDQESADRGRATIEGLLDEGVKRRKLTEEGKAATLARLTATPDYGALAGCDLVVEAVFEDLALKAEVTERIEAAAGPDAIVASNTSTLPISDLAKAASRPGRFVGIHFFSPVHKMMLVEIIRGAATEDAAVAKAMDFVRQLKKTPVVVNDARFFYANRCIIPYVNEGVRMVAEGVRPALVENAARQAGMPVGPLQLSDEVSLELGWRIAQATKAAMGAAYPESPADALLQAMVEEKRRLGRKSGGGFYDYDGRGKRAGLWPGLAEMYPPAADQPDVTEVKNRLLAVQALEAVRALEEGVLVDVREGDVGAILGWGFAPWSGGPFSWIDILGRDQVRAMSADLAARHGPRFTPPATLSEPGRFHG